MEHSPKISFCTGCKGRLHQLRRTLPNNLLLNVHTYPNVEFVLLDYNSQDGFGEWVRTALSEFVELGIVGYFHESHCRFWNMSHAKNVSHLCATGAIVCNLDADNRVVPDFARHLSTLMTDPRAARCVSAPEATRGRYDTCGRIALYRHDFEHLGGYSEDFTGGYGLEDFELLMRVDLAGLRRTTWSRYYDSAIRHDEAERAEYLPVPLSVSRHQSEKVVEASRKSRTVVANPRPWGAARLVRNFSEEVSVSSDRPLPVTCSPASPLALRRLLRRQLVEQAAVLRSPHSIGRATRDDGASFECHVDFTRNCIGQVEIFRSSFDTDDEDLAIAGGLMMRSVENNHLHAIRAWDCSWLAGGLAGCDPESMATVMRAFHSAMDVVGV